MARPCSCPSVPPSSTGPIYRWAPTGSWPKRCAPGWPRRSAGSSRPRSRTAISRTFGQAAETGFPGSTNLSGGTLTALVHEVLSEFARHGAQRLLVLIGHGEDEWFTREACDLAARDVAAAGREVQIMLIGYWEVRDPGFIASIYPVDEPLVPQLQHAAWTETSMMLHAFPDLVRRSEFPPDEKAVFPPYDVFPEPRDLVPASGVFSATSTATEESGRALISHTVERITEAARKEFGL